jgi:hypothetical protein
VQFQRRGVVCVVDTDYVVLSTFAWRSHAQSRYRFRLISRRPMPCPSYQCNSALRTRPLRSRIVASPLSFRHRARPYARLSRARPRTPMPRAMGSTSVIWPMTVNSSISYCATRPGGVQSSCRTLEMTFWRVCDNKVDFVVRSSRQ